MKQMKARDDEKDILFQDSTVPILRNSKAVFESLSELD